MLLGMNLIRNLIIQHTISTVIHLYLCIKKKNQIICNIIDQNNLFNIWCYKGYVFLLLIAKNLLTLKVKHR